MVLSVLLLGCAKAEEPGLEVVTVPVAAYGPFDGGIGQPVIEAGPEASATVRAPHPPVRCYAIDDLPEGQRPAPPPFDNCPREMDGDKFEPKSTSERRARNRNMCCYAVTPGMRGVLTIDPND
jgi:hypothetical protein